MPHRHKTSGLTLVELMAIIAIIAISLNLMVPLTASFVKNQQKEATRNTFLSAFRFARAIAIDQRKLITICTTSASGSCMDAWGDTVSVFTDSNGNAQMDSEDTLIQTVHIDISGWKQHRLPAGRAHFQWGPLGLSHGTAGSIELCGTNTRPGPFAIIVSFSGRIRTSRDYDGDGVEERDPGTPISC